MNKKPPSTNDHVLLTCLKSVCGRAGPDALVPYLEWLDISGVLNVPFKCADLRVLHEVFPVLPEVYSPRTKSPLVVLMEETSDSVALVKDAFLTGKDSLFVVSFVYEADEAMKWLRAMARPSLIYGTAGEFGLMAAPLKAFLL